jgi:hypothetical protein
MSELVCLTDTRCIQSRSPAGSFLLFLDIVALFDLLERLLGHGDLAFLSCSQVSPEHRIGIENAQIGRCLVATVRFAP